MKAIELKNQLLNYSDEELSELDLLCRFYNPKDGNYYNINDFLLIHGEYQMTHPKKLIGLILTNVDRD